MSCRTFHRTTLALPLALVFAGCAAAVTPVAEPEPISAEAAEPLEVVAEDSPPPVRERDAAPRDRWLTPFAVSSSGQAEPLRPRAIVVVGSDSAIAAGLSAQQAIDLNAANVERAERSAAADSGRGRSDTATSTVRTAAAPRDDPAGRDPLDEPAGGPDDGDDSGPESRGNSASEINTRSHLVQRGDTWLGIVARYRVSASALADANPNADPQRIRIGQRLMIPAAAADEARSRVHRVGPGDTLSEIADRYSVPQAAIRRANNLSGDRLRVGQTLTIPVGN
jgi:LysM repeat protein